MGSTLTNTNFTTKALDGTTRLALLKIDYNAGTSSLWMDPDISTFNGTQTPDLIENFAPAFNHVNLHNRESGVATDEITLATTWQAALHLSNPIREVTSSTVISSGPATRMVIQV